MLGAFWNTLILIVIGCALISLLLYYGEYKEFSIDERIRNGSNPQLPNKKVIYRPHEIELLRNTFINQREIDMFGVILGPSGTGKTFIIKQVCRSYPSGVLYYEIDDLKLFPQGLAREIKMKLEDDANTPDLVLEKVGIKPVNFKLPKDTSDAISFVLRTLSARAAVYKQKYGRVPCLFIDGVDQVAKKDSKMFLDLMDSAKRFANSGILLIVLVSSEGSVVSLLDSTSSITSQANVIEILDINREESYDYLRVKGIPEGLLAPIFNFTGGRFLYFNKAAGFYHTYKQKFGRSENDAFDAIKKYLSVEFVEKKISHMNDYSMAKDMMKRIVQENTISYSKLMLTAKETTRSSIEGLIKLNLLRYTADGSITWHSELVRNVVLSEPEIWLEQEPLESPEAQKIIVEAITIFWAHSSQFIVTIVGILISTLIGCWYKPKLVYAIDKRLRTGSNPGPLSPNKKLVERPEIQDLQNAFIHQTEVNSIGVVVGPRKTGKTTIIRQVSTLSPSGVLYYLVDDPKELPQGLAYEIKMKLEEDCFDHILEKVTIKHFQNCFKLPTDTSKAVEFVLRTLAERAVVYKRKNNGKVPCLFIDGVDRVVKKDPELFQNLLGYAESHANKGELLIVLVSESRVLPLLETRTAKIIEILDLNPEHSCSYLRDHLKDIPEHLLASIINVTGGRFMYLNMYLEQKPCKTDDKAIEEHFVKLIEDRESRMDKYSKADDVMKCIVKNDTINTRGQSGAMLESIKGLIELDILRYTPDGNVTWHSKLVKNVLHSRFKKAPSRWRKRLTTSINNPQS